MPLGIRSRDAQLVVAYETLGNLLLRNTLSTKDLPPALYNCLNEECTARVKLYLKKLGNNLLNVIYSDLSQVGINLPSRTSFDKAAFSSSVDWDISNLVASSGQPDASVREQRKVLIQGKTMIDNYRRGYSGFIQNPLVMGVAGSGKTTLQECI
jgi:hypothetical protein